MKRPKGVPKQAKLLPDGRWVEENRDANGVPHNGWRYYDARGETVEIAYYDKGKYYQSYRYLPHATVTINFRKREGEITRASHGAEDAVHVADDLPPFPSRETKTIVFTMKSADAEARSFVIGEVTYFDEKGKRLSGAGGIGAPPVPGATLVKTKHDRMWRSGPRGRSGISHYYEVDGSPAFEVELDDGKLVSVGMFVDGGWLRQRFLPTPAFLTDTLKIEHEPGRHVLTMRGKARELQANKNLATFVKDAHRFFDPALKSSGVVLRFGKYKVTRFTHIPCRKPFAVTCIAEVSGGDEYVVVLEPGPYEGKVFLNDHEQGLFSVDTLDEWVEEELPGLMRKGDTMESVLADRTRLISLAPFTKQPIAASVDAFVAGLRVELAEDWQARLKPFVGTTLHVPKTPPTPTGAVSKAPARVRAKLPAKKVPAKKVPAKKVPAKKVPAKKAR